MKSSTIFIYNHYAHPPNIPGSTRHYDFAKELVRRGYDVTIFASSYIHGKNVDIITDNRRIMKANYEGIDFIWIKTPPYNDTYKRIINMIWYAVKVIIYSRKVKKPDIIIGSSVHLFTCLSAYFIAKRYNSKLIIEIRDLWPETLVDIGMLKENSIIAKALYLIERFIYRKADKIIVLLPGAINYISDLGVKKEKIIWISNGVDIKEFDREKGINSEGNIHLDLYDNRNCFNIIYTGSHGISNQLSTIIEAASIIGRQNNNIKFVFVGDGPEKVNLIKQAEDSRLDNVIFLNSVNKESVPSILRKADALIISMKAINVYKYGISLNKLFDYLCAGKPIIFAGDVSNDIVKEANAGITVPPENPQELANAILELYSMPERDRDKYGDNGRAYVEKYFDIQVLVDKLEMLLSEL